MHVRSHKGDALSDAAPDLLDALKELLFEFDGLLILCDQDGLQSGTSLSKAKTKALEAIAMAEGQMVPMFFRR